MRYCLVSDGSSDRMLVPILSWLLRQRCPTLPIEAIWADLGRLPRPPKRLSDKITASIDLYQPDLLFIHRDAEGMPSDNRRQEIQNALVGVTLLPTICVVPIRMQEAWLLFEEGAIRLAAGNPAGRSRLQMPPINRIEDIPNPKALLFDLIKAASCLHGARLKKLKPHKMAHQITISIEDFSPLSNLSSFRELERDVSDLVIENGWGGA